MSKSAAIDETAVPDAPLTSAQLMQLFATMNAENAKVLAAAIVEAQKPYVDPKTEENERVFREMTKRQMEQERENMRAAQTVCPHIAGCNSLSELRDPAGRSSIVWHRTDATEVLGICTNCIRIIRETDPDYVELRRRPSFNRMSESGNREYADPRAARERARG